MKNRVTLPKARGFTPPTKPSGVKSKPPAGDKLIDRLRDAYRQAQHGDCAKAFNSILDVAYKVGKHGGKVDPKVLNALKIMRTVFPERCVGKR